MNTEHKFQELHQQLDRLDTNAAQARIEARLRLAWAEHRSTESSTTMTTPTPAKRWNWLRLTLGGSAITALAFTTTLLLQPAPTITTSQAGSVTATTFDTVTPLGGLLGTRDLVVNPVSENTTKKRSAKKHDIDTTGSVTIDSDLTLQDAQVSDGLILDDEVLTDRDYTYNEGATDQQLFDESVGLSIEIKGEMLDAIHALRSEVSTLGGQLVDISYYGISGTMDIELPSDQLSTFEETLKGLDADQAVEVLSYNVTNVSAEIVSIDDGIQQAQDHIAQVQQELTVTGLSDEDRQRLNDQIQENEDYIKEQQTARAETIANHDLVAVRVILEKYSSFFDGNYAQYDRSTFSGLIKYELGKAIFTLIRSTGKLTVFLVWLLVYSIVLIPSFWLLRWIIRKVVSKLRKPQN